MASWYRLGTHPSRNSHPGCNYDQRPELCTHELARHSLRLRRNSPHFHPQYLGLESNAHHPEPHAWCPRIRFPCRRPHFLDPGPTKHCKDRFHAVLKWRRLELHGSEPHGGADFCHLLTRLYVSLSLIKPLHPNPHPSLRRSCSSLRRNQRRRRHRPKGNGGQLPPQRPPRPRLPHLLPFHHHQRRRRTQRPIRLPLPLGPQTDRLHGRPQRHIHPSPRPPLRGQRPHEHVLLPSNLGLRPRQRPPIL
jgi:hypothetical protein